MNIAEATELKARIAALEARIERLELSQSEQKSREIAAPHVANGQTLSLKGKHA